MGVSPNPAASRAVVRFTLGTPADVTARVYDTLGREVLAVDLGPLAAGADGSVSLDVSALPPGVYVVRLAAGDGTTTSARFTVVR